jgi:hypothetical protein
MINWIIGWFVPSVDGAIAGLNKAVKGLDKAQARHSNKADKFMVQATRSTLAAGAHTHESERARAIKEKINGLLNV